MLLFPYPWAHAMPIQDSVKGKSPSKPCYWSPLADTYNTIQYNASYTVENPT